MPQEWKATFDVHSIAEGEDGSLWLATSHGLLWRLLETQLAPVPIERLDRHGVPAEARKALAFAALAALAMDGVPANVPASTGAAGPRLLGSFTPGAGANWARCLAWMAGQTAHLRLAA